MSLPESVKQAVAAAVRVDYGEVTGWSGPVPRPWSWHLRVETARAPLLVKVPRWEGIDDLDAALAAGPQADTAAEFAALEGIHRMVEAANDPGLTAVVPVAYVAPINAIVMEVMAGASLRARLGTGAPSEAEGWFGALGRWLGLYHRTGGGTRVAFSAADERRRWDAMAVHAPARRADLMRAAQAADRLDGRPVTAGVQHGDLTLGNVLVGDDGRVAVIDPNRTPGRWEADAARILAETALGRNQLLTLGLLRRRAAIDSWARALSSGHGALDGEVLDYDRGAEALERRISLAGGNAASRLVGLLASPRFAGELTRRFGPVS